MESVTMFEWIFLGIAAIFAASAGWFIHHSVLRRQIKQARGRIKTISAERQIEQAELATIRPKMIKQESLQEDIAKWRGKAENAIKDLATFMEEYDEMKMAVDPLTKERDDLLDQLGFQDAEKTSWQQQETKLKEKTDAQDEELKQLHYKIEELETLTEKVEAEKQALEQAMLETSMSANPATKPTKPTVQKVSETPEHDVNRDTAQAVTFEVEPDVMDDAVRLQDAEAQTIELADPLYPNQEAEEETESKLQKAEKPIQTQEEILEERKQEQRQKEKEIARRMMREKVIPKSRTSTETARFASKDRNTTDKFASKQNEEEKVDPHYKAPLIPQPLAETPIKKISTRPKAPVAGSSSKPAVPPGALKWKKPKKGAPPPKRKDKIKSTGIRLLEEMEEELKSPKRNKD